MDSEWNPLLPDARERWLRAAGWLGLLLGLWLAPERVRAEYASVTPDECITGRRPADELWLVSTRELPSGACGATFQPEVQRYADQAGWQSTSLAELVNAPARPTLIYVHGNRMAWDDAVRSSWDLYYSLTRWHELPPMRLIIWSWPSDQIPGLLRDVRVKADRADTESFYLAEFLGQMPPDAPLSLVGYSFGSRVIAGGLHLVGGGVLYGRSLEAMGQWPHRTASTRAALLAPALEDLALAEGQIFGQAARSAQQILVLYNTCDPVLKRYYILDQCRSHRAMGYSGAVGALPENVVWEQDVGPWVGRTHSLSSYLGSPDVIGTTSRYALFTSP